MKKLIGYTIALGILVLTAFVPAMFFGYSFDDGASTYEPTTITSYVADFALDEDGDLDVVETLTVNFPSGDRHGIFRFFDRLDDSEPHVRRIVEDVEVEMDGSNEPFEMLTEDVGRYDVAKIGDAGVFLSPGEHVYELSYSVPGVISEGDNGSESQFYWNLIPAGWEQDIDRSELTVHLPTEAGAIDCGVGLGDAPDPCEVAGEGTDTITVTTGALSDHTPVTLRVGLDLATPDAGTTLPWTGRYDRVLGQSVAALVVVLLLAAAAAAFGVAMARRAFERTPGLPLTYEPPVGIGPAQAAYVLDERIDRTAYVATLMHAAEHGAVDLGRSGKAWTITDAGGTTGWQGLDPVSTSVAHLLGGPGTTFTADPDSVSAGLRLKTEIETFEASVKSWGTTSGNLVSVRFGGMLALLALGGLVTALALIIFNPFHMTLVALIPGAFGIFGAPLLKTGATTKRTRAGRELWSRVGGFKRILSTDSAVDRFEFSGREELYTKYVPWAVAFGCADEWAKKYRIETGTEPPTPTYFAHSYAGASLGSVTSMVDDFDSAVGSAISSYNATQSSSSSSGGGGGFSGGGGGGGGGGGSW